MTARSVMATVTRGCPAKADQRADRAEPDTAGAASATNEPPVESPVETNLDEPEGPAEVR